MPRERELRSEQSDAAARLRAIVELRNVVFTETFGHRYETCVFLSSLRNDVAQGHKWHLRQFDMLIMGEREYGASRKS